MRRLLSIACFLTLLGSTTAEGAVTIEAPQGARQPQMCIDSSGTIQLAFGMGDAVFYSRSSDAGNTFCAPIEVATLESLALGMRRGPRIAVSGNAIVISGIGGSKDHQSDGNLYAWRSTDQGESWQPAVPVNDMNASAREGLHGMAAGQNGELYCVWLDDRNKKGKQVFGSRSVDAGATWSKNVLIYQSPAGTVCQCCHPSVALDAKGKVYVMWRNVLDGNRDMYLTISHDQGETFGPAVKIGEGSWPLEGCPMDGGAIAVSADGKITTAWRRDHAVFLTDPGYLQERQLGLGTQPWVAADHHGMYVVWIGPSSDSLYLANSVAGQPTQLADDAKYPVVATSPTEEGPVVVAWESKAEPVPQIKVARIDRE